MHSAARLFAWVTAMGALGSCSAFDEAVEPSPDAGAVGPDAGDGGDASEANAKPADADANASRGFVVFVTKALYVGFLGGLAGADAKCKGAADSPGSGVPSGANWRAWLSIKLPLPGVAALGRLPPTDGPYVTSNGVRIASGPSDLVDGMIETTIDRDEFGELAGPETAVWTGTTAQGLIGADTCDEWTSEAPDGRAGSMSKTSSAWTEVGTARTCNSAARLYCFQTSVP